MAASPLGADGPQRRLPLGKQILGGGNLADLLEDVLEILPVGVVGMFAEEEFVRVLGQLAAFAFPGQPAFVDQMIVFHEPHEDAGQHPRHGDLIEIVVPPDFKRLGRAAPFSICWKASLNPASILASLVERASKSSASSVTSFSQFRQQCLDGDHASVAAFRCDQLGGGNFLGTTSMHVVDPAFGDFGPLTRRDERNLRMIENRHVVLPVGGHQNPEARTGSIVPHLVPQRFQNRHLVVAGDQPRMHQQQMLPPLSQSSRNLRSCPSDEMQQVLPILTGGIGTIGLFDDGPIDFQFLGFFPQGIEQQVVERNPLQIEPPQ